MQEVVHALLMLVKTLSVDKPLGLFQFTLKYPIGVGDNVGLMFQSFEPKFCGFCRSKHFAYRPFYILLISKGIFQPYQYFYSLSKCSRTCFDKAVHSDPVGV